MNTTANRRKLIFYLSSALVILIAFFSLYSILTGRTSKADEVKWDGATIATKFSGGNGTLENPYVISNGPELAYFKKLLEEENDKYKDKYYELGNNIDLDYKDFESIGDLEKTFNGSLDGNGYKISNLKITNKTINNTNYYSLFVNTNKATIKNISFVGVEIVPEELEKNIIVSIISNKIIESKISNIVINNSKFNLTKSSKNDLNRISGLITEVDEKSEVNNIYLHTSLVSEYKDNMARISYKTDGKMTNIYSYYESGLLLVNDIDSFIETNKDASDKIINNTSELIEIVKRYEDEDYEFIVEENNVLLKKKEKVEESTNTNSEINNNEIARSFDFSIVKSPTITLHDSGKSGNTVYVNDLESDLDYYTGLNYTYRSNGSWPDGTSSGIYDSGNLAKVYIAYKGSEINTNSTVVGYVSLTDQYSDFIYYKYYPIENGYVTIPLIDNPYGDRPDNRAFNGWVTDYNGAVVSLDTDTYTRYVKVPASSEINITMYASWTEATVANSPTSNTLKNVSMQRVGTGINEYFDVPTLYDRRTITTTNQNPNASYPNGAVDENGNSLYYSRCSAIYTGGTYVHRTCTYYIPVSVNSLQVGQSLYELSNGTMTSFIVPPKTREVISFMNTGDSLAGYFKVVRPTGSLVGYYDSTGRLLTSGTGNGRTDYYQLVQYNDGDVLDPDTYTNYYYLVTRDTNIAYLTAGINGFNNSRPVTVTGVNNGVDNSNVEININGNNRYIRAGADLRIEYVTLSSGVSAASANGPANGTTNLIYGNYYNLKVGRGIGHTTGSNGSWWNPQTIDYFSANAVVGGNNGSTGSSGTRTKYSLIVESGTYNTISAVSTTNNNGNVYVNGTAVYGCDYDRISEDNSKLEVAYNIAGTHGGNVRTASSTELFLDATVKSGTIGTMTTESASGIYCGGLTGGTIYAPSKLTIEGGDVFNVNGGPLISSNLTSYNTIYINMKGGEVDAIFGGAARTETYGNRIINVTGGLVNYSVFGGSNGSAGTNGEGTLDGNTFIYAGGKAVIGNTSLNNTLWGAEVGSIFGAGNGRSGTNYNKIGSVNNSRIVIGSSVTINSNVYGGANFGESSVTNGTSNMEINMNGGTVHGSLYGGGNNNGVGTVNNSGNNTAVGNTFITVNGGTIDNSVFGGSRTRGRIAGNTNVTILGGTIGNVYGGGEGGYSNNTDYGTYVNGNVSVQIGNATSSPTITGNVYGGSAFGTVNGYNETATTNTRTVNVNVTNGVIRGNLFGGGQGGTNNTPKEYGNITVTIDGGNISNVFGGNDYAGRPGNGDVVYLNGGTIGNAFGGGNQTGQNTTNIYLQGSTLTGNLYGGSNESGTVTTTNVTVTSGTVNNVFGGNNLGGSSTTTNVTITGGTIEEDVYGGGNEASSGTTNVLINSGNLNNVFGGGNEAGVTTKANVTVNNGTIDNVYGGSNNAGAVAVTDVKIYDGDIQKVFGGNNLGGSVTTSNVLVNDGEIEEVYGGGNQVGLTTSNVRVTGGEVTSVYGGSNLNGNVTTSNVTVGGANTLNITDVYGGNNLGGRVSQTNVIVTQSNIENLYGGGNQAPVGSTNLRIGNGTVQNIYGGGNAAEVTGNTYLDVEDATIPTNLYGGGNQGAVRGNTEVYVTDTTVGGSIYAGGNGASAIVYGNTTVSVDGDTVVGNSSSTGTQGSVFGGGNAASTGTDTNGNSIAVVNIVGGHIYGNVYGGANTSVVYGETHTNIGTEAVNTYLANLREEQGNSYVAPFDVTALTESDLTIDGTVFGGGEANASGSDSYDWNFISVTDSIDIVIDGSNYDTHNHVFKLSGSIFGSGNASTSRGDSSITIKKLGSYENVSRNISIQRTGTLTIDNSWIELSGIEDSTNDYSDIKYTFNQINKLILKNNSTLLLKKNANLLKELYSGVDVGGELVPAKVTINTSGQTTYQNVDNRIYMIPDNNLNVTTNQAATTYGRITGMTFFGMYNSYAGGGLQYGMYDKSFHNGDAADASDLVMGGSYVLGLHLANHNITINGFYSNYMDDDYTHIETDYVKPSEIGENGYRWIIGQYSINYNFSLTASKYSSLGTHELSMYDFSKGDTTFKVLGFNSEGLAPEVELIDPLYVPKLTETEEEANRTLGLAMKSETHEWTSYETTKFLSEGNGVFIGDDEYKTDSQALSPSLMFYFYHAKNISLDQELGTVVVTLQAAEPLNAIEYKMSLVTITIDLYAKEYDDGDSYDASISYGKKYEMPTANDVNITNQSQFSTYFSLFATAEEMEDIYGLNGDNYHCLVTDYALPVGTQITMIDYGVNDTNPDFYYFTVDQADYNRATAQLASDNEVSYKLNNFIRMGSTSATNKYSDLVANDLYYDDSHNRTIEEFMFIIDFKETNQTGTHENNSMLFELRNSEDRSLLTVLGIRQNLMDYNLYDSGNTVLLGILNDFDGYLYQNRTSLFNYVTSVGYQENENRSSIIDTNYEGSPMGINVSLIDASGSQVSSSILTGTTIRIDNHYYFADSDGVWRINLAGKVSNLNKNVELLTDTNLHPGSYTLKITLFASSDGLHNSNPERSHTLEVPLTVVGDENAIKVTTNDETKVVDGLTSLNEDKEDTNTYNVKIMSVLADPNLRVTIMKRNVDNDSTTEFSQVPFNTLFKNSLSGTANEKLLAIEPDEESSYDFVLANNLTSGTYRVVFELYDGDYLVDSDFEYVIVTKPVIE